MHKFLFSIFFFFCAFFLLKSSSFLVSTNNKQNKNDVIFHHSRKNELSKDAVFTQHIVWQRKKIVLCGVTSPTANEDDDVEVEVPDIEVEEQEEEEIEEEFDDEELEEELKPKPRAKKLSKKATWNLRVQKVLDAHELSPPLPSGEYLHPLDNPLAREMIVPFSDSITAEKDDDSDDEDEDEKEEDPYWKPGVRGLVVIVASNYSSEDIAEARKIETIIKDNFGDRVGVVHVPVWFEWRDRSKVRQFWVWFEGLEEIELYNRKADADMDGNMPAQKIQEMIQEIEYLISDDVFNDVYGDLYEPYSYNYMEWLT